MKMFHSEVDAFIGRVHARAAQKRADALAEVEAEERQARIDASPGGLDPVEVMESLPQSMRDAFESQQVSRLQQVAAEMDEETFKHHLDRCIKSGLWLPQGGVNKDDVADGDQS